MTAKETDRDIYGEIGNETDRHRLAEKMIQTETDGGREIETRKDRGRDRRRENI
jgi:hypothetical protein